MTVENISKHCEYTGNGIDQMNVYLLGPVVCRLSKSNPDEEANVSYPQSLMEWKPYSILTTSQNRKNFSGADLSEIVLNELFVMPQKQRPSTTKPRYSPYIYRIDFHINITVGVTFSYNKGNIDFLYRYIFLMIHQSFNIVLLFNRLHLV